jgi:hypothetical protein
MIVVRIALTLVSILLAAAPARADIWFAAVDSYSQPTNPTGAEFMRLFTSDAEWNAAAAKVQILKASTQFLHQATDAEVSAVIHGLQSRHIKLGMEGLLLVESARCGRGVESYGGRGAIQALADRLVRLGGTISYVAMDEPLWFGNYASGPKNCHDSVEDLAQQMAPNVRALKAAFPAIQFGDIEPINAKSVGRIDTILQFARAFREATGEQISFVHADIIWQQDWRPQVIEWKARLHREGIRFGVIFDGDPQDQTDVAWTERAVERYRNVMADGTTRPDDAIFQSWMLRPTRLLPDFKNGTLTNVVLDALKAN